MDYSFQGTLGIFLCLGIANGSGLDIFNFENKIFFIGIGITALNLFCLLIVFPIFFSQITSLCNTQTIATLDKNKVEVDKNKVKVEGIEEEVSDDSSMFVRVSDDWNPKSSANQASFLTPKRIKIREESCCFQSTRSTEFL